MISNGPQRPGVFILSEEGWSTIFNVIGNCLINDACWLICILSVSWTGLMCLIISQSAFRYLCTILRPMPSFKNSIRISKYSNHRLHFNNYPLGIRITHIRRIEWKRDLLYPECHVGCFPVKIYGCSRPVMRIGVVGYMYLGLLKD